MILKMLLMLLMILMILRMILLDENKALEEVNK